MNTWSKKAENAEDYKERMEDALLQLEKFKISVDDHINGLMGQIHQLHEERKKRKARKRELRERGEDDSASQSSEKGRRRGRRVRDRGESAGGGGAPAGRSPRRSRGAGPPREDRTTDSPRRRPRGAPLGQRGSR